MNSSNVVEKIRAFDFDALRSSLSESPEPQGSKTLPEIIDTCVSWIRYLQDELVRLIEEIGEGEDVEMALAIQYVEFKSRWIAFNTRMNYAMFKGVLPEVEDQCRAASLSAFLGHVEPLLNPEDIDRITDFLAQPLNEAA